MSEGAEIRRAFDGPDITHDSLIDHLTARIAEEHERSSDASESAAKTSEYVEKTGMNSQALAWCKTILKKMPKKDGQAKAMDVIMSMEAALPMVKAHVAGQGTADMFPEDNGDTVKVTAALGEPESPDVPEEFADDTADFYAHASEVENDTVEPIDFGSAAE